MENVKTEEKELLKFTTKSIKFTEIMSLSGLVFNFIKVSGATEKIQNTKFFKEGNGNFLELLSEVPEVIFKNQETMEAFLKIVEFCTGKDFDNDQSIENMKVIKRVIDFLHELGILNFLQQMTMMLVNWTRG